MNPCRLTKTGAEREGRRMGRGVEKENNKNKRL